jgi:integrase
MRPALPLIGAYLAELERSGTASRALRRQRSWALREAVLFAAARHVRAAAGEGAELSAELSAHERDQAQAATADITLGELLQESFVDDWLAHADPVLRGVSGRNTATQRARVTSLRVLAAFAGGDLPAHRHAQPVPRVVLTGAEVDQALSALTRQLPGRGPDDHVRLGAVLGVMSAWPVRSAELSRLELSQVDLDDGLVKLAVGERGGAPVVLSGTAADRFRDWLAVRAGLVAALQGGPVRAVWTSIKSNSRPGGPHGSLPLPPGMPLRPRGLQRAYARSVEAANAVHHGLPGFPLPRSLDLLRRSLLAR